MPKPTIKSLEEQIKTLRGLREQDARRLAEFSLQYAKANDKLIVANAELDALRKDKQWLKQIAQEQSSSISAYMRSR